MKAIKYIFSALVGMAALVSCDSNITDFEYQGYTGAPKTIDASAVTSEALPGAIRLNWTVPADSTFSGDGNQCGFYPYPYAPHREYFEEVW